MGFSLPNSYNWYLTEMYFGFFCWEIRDSVSLNGFLSPENWYIHIRSWLCVLVFFTLGLAKFYLAQLYANTSAVCGE
jgi:hypothetical protein